MFRLWAKIFKNNRLMKDITIENDALIDPINKTLLYYFGASSVSLIQRVKVLNSGNVPLGFLMKNVVEIRYAACRFLGA